MNGKKVLLAAAGVLILGVVVFAVWKMTGESLEKASKKEKAASVTEKPESKPETQEEWAERIRQMRKDAENGGTVDFRENDLFTIRVTMKDVKDPVYIMTLTYKLGDDVMGMQTTAQYNQEPIENDPGFTLSPLEFPEGRTTEGFTFWLGIYDREEEGKGEPEHFCETELCEAFTPEYGKAYEFALSGSYEKGFMLTRQK